MSVRFATPADLLHAVGTELGHGDWFTVDQDRVDRFAAATDDPQWIHVDAARAAAGPFGGPVAHGYLTLALLTALTQQLLDVGGTALVVNAGLNRVRFLAPVRVGARIRAAGRITGAETVPAGVRVTTAVTVELEGAQRPALVAETLTIFAPADGRPDAGHEE